MTDLGKAVYKSNASKSATGIEYDKQKFQENHEGKWVEDSECSACTKCHKRFTLARRRHHCRECGNIFCYKCSKYQVVVSGYVRRACLNCYKKVIEQSQQSVPSPLQVPSESESRRGSIAKQLAPRPSVDSRSVAGSSSKRADDIYGRLTYAGSEVPGFISTGNSGLEPKISELESSFEKTVDEKSNIFSPWIHAILFIRTDDSLSPVLEASVPKGRISEATAATILDHSMPEILNPADGYPKVNEASVAGDEGDMIEYNYTYRVRCNDEEDDVSELEVDKFFNCFVAFREVMNVKDKVMRRQSLVIVTRWPIPHFAYRLLGKIEEALWHVFTVGFDSIVDKEDSGSKASPASQALHVAYGQFLGWPFPVADTPMSLPFFGEILQLTLPGNMFSQHQPTTPMSATVAEGKDMAHPNAENSDVKKHEAPFYVQSNLISVFGPLGLVPHLWGFWEVLMTGKDIVVVAERPSLCSEVVMALSTLARPKGFKGEVWPFVSARGGLADDIGMVLKEKAQSIHAVNADKASMGTKKWKPEQHIDLLKSARFSCIIGITNPALLKQFDGVSTVIFASPSPVEWFGLDRYSSRLSASMRLYDASQSFSAKNKDGTLSCSDFYMSSYRLWSRGLHRVSSGLDKREVTTLLAVQGEPSSGEQERVTKRLRKLSKKDYVALGAMMLRDHFCDLTTAFHKPLELEESVPNETAAEPAVALQTDVRDRFQEERPMLSDAEYRREVTRQKVNSLHDWLQDNRPTVIMYVVIVAAIVVYVWLGLPIILVVVGIYFVQVPEKAPKGVEIMLQEIFPKTFLYPNKYKVQQTVQDPRIPSNNTPQSQVASSAAPAVGSKLNNTQSPGVTDFSGIWKRVKTINFDNIVGAQGASYVQKKLAASITITHTITMNPPHCDTIRLQEKGGPMDSDRLFTIGGEPQELPQGKKTFLDSLEWSTTEPGVLITRKVHLPERDYELMSKRYLEGSMIRMTFLYHEYATKKEVEGSAWFERVGDSPNPPPESSSQKDDVELSKKEPGDEERKENPDGNKSVTKRVNFSGVWNAVRRVNVEAYAGAMGAGYVQRKLAANAPMTHTFTTDNGTANYLGIRIQEKAGPINSDVTYIANNSKSTRTIVKKTYTETVTWHDDALVLRRVHEAGDFEVVLTRKMEDGDDGIPEIVLTSLHRDLLTGKETVATIWWKKVEPSPNDPVVVSPELIDGSGVDSSTNISADQKQPQDTDGDSSGDEEEDNRSDDIALPVSGNSFPRALSTTPRVDMTGVWKRVEAQNYDAFVGAQGAGYVQRKLAASMALQHTIILNPPLFSEFTLQEKGGPLDTNLHYDIGTEEPVENFILKKKFLDSCDWEGGALVTTRRHVAGDFELIFRRYLEMKDGEEVIRLVAIHRDLKNGGETESISFFRKVGMPAK